MRRTATYSHPILQKLKDAYVRLEAMDKGVLLAVSGGADSSALLFGTHRLASELQIKAEVASLDHGLRPESASEVSHVRLMTERLGMPFHTRALSLTAGAGLEARARDARYQALEEIRSQAQLDCIATAHTASDQAETVLMRLLRGASTRGAAGILERRGWIIRPLLGCLREETEHFVRQLGVSHVVDPMNADHAFLRPRIRSQLMPVLAELAGPKAALHLAHFARLMQEDAALLDALADGAYASLCVAPAQLDAKGVKALLPPLRRRVLAHLIRETGAEVDNGSLERAMQAVSRGGRATLPGGLTLHSASGVVRCIPPQSPSHEPLLLELREGWIEDPLARMEIGLVRSLPASVGLWIKVDKVVPPLWVRRRKPGDRVTTAEGRSRKLQDLLVDLAIPVEKRDALPVVIDAQGKVLWVIGVWPRQQHAAAPGGWYLVAKSLSGG